MTDAFEDPGRVGTAITAARDRQARRKSELQSGAVRRKAPAAGTLRALPTAPPGQPPGVLAREATAAQEVQSAAPVDPTAYYRLGRFGVVGAILLLLVLLWIRERRSGRSGA